ncbi:MAG: hypothetical protein LBK60_00450 [Verrucomicrobiales bacterium]|nr:hypothetical protein [Verrucomicrobiales bacterium]
MGNNNTFTELDIDIVARGTLQAFKTALLPVSVFATNLSPTPAQKGDTVRVLCLPAQSGTKDFAGKCEVSGSDADTVPVQINKHKYTGYYLTDKEAIGPGVRQHRDVRRGEGVRPRQASLAGHPQRRHASQIRRAHRHRQRRGL